MLKRAQDYIYQEPDANFKTTLNTSTGDFFYDPWVISDEYKNTVWEEILDTLPYNKGEARLINLSSGSCYTSHGDIDDRWHISIISEHSYLANLETNKLYPTTCDLTWYYFNAGPKHTAVNLDYRPRYQLVVRTLLDRNILNNSVTVEIKPKQVVQGLRYHFDNLTSPWLNRANKRGIITDFKTFNNEYCQFKIDNNYLTELKLYVPEQFQLKVIDE